ncbi:hypothetical protein [Neisseria zalophi]|nr:hypothetical protein [Neisseria zalophi]
MPYTLSGRLNKFSDGLKTLSADTKNKQPKPNQSKMAEMGCGFKIIG